MHHKSKHYVTYTDLMQTPTTLTPENISQNAEHIWFGSNTSTLYLINFCIITIIIIILWPPDRIPESMKTLKRITKLLSKFLSRWQREDMTQQSDSFWGKWANSLSSYEWIFEKKIIFSVRPIYIDICQEATCTKPSAIYPRNMQ